MFVRLPRRRTLVLTTSLGLAWACAGAPRPPVPTGPTVQPLGPGVHDLDLGKDLHGEARTARVIWPKGAVKGAVWIFHGGRDSRIDELAPGWKDHRDRGWVLVFPQGQRTRPSEGAWFTPVDGESPHMEPLLDLHARLEAGGVHTHVATGFSSGAHMTWRLACEQSEPFDAFVPVGHFLRADVAKRCQPEVVRPVLLVAMEDDEVAPYEGRPGPDGTPHNLGADASMKHMARLAHCRGKPTTDEVQGGVHLRWPRCEVEHLKLAQGGHRWPNRGADVVLDFANRVLD